MHLLTESSGPRHDLSVISSVVPGRGDKPVDVWLGVIDIPDVSDAVGLGDGGGRLWNWLEDEVAREAGDGLHIGGGVGLEGGPHSLDGCVIGDHGAETVEVSGNVSTHFLVRSQNGLPLGLIWGVKSGGPGSQSSDVVNSNGRWDRSEVGENLWLNLVSSLDTEELGLDGTSSWSEASAENTTGTSVNLILVLGEVDDSGDVGWNRWLKEDLDGRADLWNVVGGEGELSDDAEVGSTSLHGPEEVWVGGSGCGDNLAGGKDHLVGDNVVHGETILGGEVGDTSSDGET